MPNMNIQRTSDNEHGVPLENLFADMWGVVSVHPEALGQSGIIHAFGIYCAFLGIAIRNMIQWSWVLYWD